MVVRRWQRHRGNAGEAGYQAGRAAGVDLVGERGVEARILPAGEAVAEGLDGDHGHR